MSPIPFGTRFAPGFEVRRVGAVRRFDALRFWLRAGIMRGP
jgi:hypothetical protein